MSEREGGGEGTTMASDQDIAEALYTLLRESNPNNSGLSSLNAVVSQLQLKLGLNLSHKVDFIRNQIQLLFRPPSSYNNFPIQFHQQQQQLQQQLQQQRAQATAVDRFGLQQNPNFHPAVVASQIQPNFSVVQGNRSQEFGYRPAQPSPVVDNERYVVSEAHVGDVVATSVVATPAVVPAAEVSKESAQPAKKKRGGPGGLNKLCGVSPQLEAVVGHPQLPRTEIVKQLWAYIRKHNLQDPSNKRKIICNDELRLLFEVDCTDMFKMNKLLAKHIIPLEPTKPTGRESKKSKVDKESSVSRNTESIPIVIISEALGNFLATGEREMAQGEVLRRVWEYIKVNQLEDPLNAMVILCDAKLQELLGCESISALGIPEVLARHHLSRRS